MTLASLQKEGNYGENVHKLESEVKQVHVIKARTRAHTSVARFDFRLWVLNLVVAGEEDDLLRLAYLQQASEQGKYPGPCQRTTGSLSAATASYRHHCHLRMLE
ncbi:hypothetical protein NDU88_010316 [Pleurodeles waltl]|uniref:Uncharacterized protein n=1 Tax=Pleurodeles waltl TaxID=8319 RepID=A0AAV7PV74_PLEWA|nr:hypothetical protein NDU88_010316 [Pleurodeles waltl]